MDDESYGEWEWHNEMAIENECKRESVRRRWCSFVTSLCAANRLFTYFGSMCVCPSDVFFVIVQTNKSDNTRFTSVSFLDRLSITIGNISKWLNAENLSSELWLIHIGESEHPQLPHCKWNYRLLFLFFY